MKFTLTFKHPNVIDQIESDHGEADFEAIKEFLPKYIQWGEYIKIEFDTEADTAQVIKIR